MTSSSLTFYLLLLIGPSSFQNLTVDVIPESTETEKIPGLMSPGDSCIFEGLLCDNIKNDSYFSDIDTLDCRQLADVVTCYEVALNKCRDDVQDRALETSRDVAEQQYKLICESCHLEAVTCSSLVESVGPHLNDTTRCSQLVEAIKCYDKIISKCSDVGERQLLEDSRSAVQRSHDITCRPCHKEKKKCDKFVERSVLSVNDTKMCSRLADAIQCYDKAANKCQGTEEIRAVNTSKGVAVKQFEFSCHTCVIEGMKCQKIMEDSSSSVNDNQVCSKLPAAILCYEKAIDQCVDDDVRRGLETSKSVVEQQYNLDCQKTEEATEKYPKEDATVIRVLKPNCLRDGNVCNNMSALEDGEMNNTKEMCSKLNESRLCFSKAVEKCVTDEEESILGSFKQTVDLKYNKECVKFDNRTDNTKLIVGELKEEGGSKNETKTSEADTLTTMWSGSVWLKMLMFFLTLAALV